MVYLCYARMLLMFFELLFQWHVNVSYNYQGYRHLFHKIIQFFTFYFFSKNLKKLKITNEYICITKPESVIKYIKLFPCTIGAWVGGLVGTPFHCYNY